MDSDITLTVEDLDALEREFTRARGDNFVAALGNGASEPELDGFADQLGVDLGEETRLWWGRFNTWNLALLPGIVPIAVEASVFVYQTKRAEAVDAARFARGRGVDSPSLLDPEFYWGREWVPLLGPPGRAIVTIDAGSGSGPASIRNIDSERLALDDYSSPCAPSLGTLVRFWTGLLMSGALVFDRQAGAWNPSSVDVGLDPSRPLTG